MIDMLEAQQGFVDVPDFDSKTMKVVLRFMYCNQVKSLKKLASDLVFAAKKYELEGLKQMCIDSMIASLAMNNFKLKLLFHRNFREIKVKSMERTAEKIDDKGFG